MPVASTDLVRGSLGNWQWAFERAIQGLFLVLGIVSLLQQPPVDERPRERLLRHGARTLADAELLAVILRTGSQGLSALEAARTLLARCGGLSGVSRAPADSLRCRGLGDAKVAALLAAMELGLRLARLDLPSGEPLREPAAVARYLCMRYARSGQEVMGGLFLDARHRLLREAEVFRGTLDRAAVEPRQILKLGLLCDAAFFVLFHTHPSGDPAPSAEDLAFTRRMAEAGDIIGIRLLDHLILGSASQWRSLKQHGAW